MNYIDVEWKTAGPTEPFRMVSELDKQRFETRKLEFFRSGAVGSASSIHTTTDTRLGSEPIPQLAEVNDDTQFSGKELTAAEFRELWSQYGRPLHEYEVVDLLATAGDLPVKLVGNKAVVLLVYDSTTSPAYEVECVAAEGHTLWLGALPREVLRAAPGSNT
jgi:hypothetical protein